MTGRPTAPYAIQVYRMANGRVPFREWFQSLGNAPTRVQILRRLFRMEAGNLGDCKLIDQGIGELRIDFGPGYRIYFAKEAGYLLILFAGGDKKTQRRDIA
jgi:putative addiction module killer protein